MEKSPLYRKVNTRARGVHHVHGGDYRHTRHTKREDTAGGMHGRGRRGLDYTPLFRFLLSKVGADWTEVYREATARLDRPDPVFWLVALDERDRHPFVCVGESSYFSGLYVDNDARLQRVDPSLRPERITPSCRCCTARTPSTASA